MRFILSNLINKDIQQIYQLPVLLVVMRHE